MSLLLRFILLLTLTFILTSCGREEIEEDKHPDLPYFPKTTNNNIKLKRVHFNPKSFYKIGDTYFNIQPKLDKNSSNNLEYLFYYEDDLLTRIDSILVKGNNFIDKNGFLYTNYYETNREKYDVNNKVTKIDIIGRTKKNINYINDDYSKEYYNIIELNKKYEKQLTHLPDSVIMEIRFKRIDSVEVVISERFRKNVLTDLQKVKRININSSDNSFLLQYQDREAILKNAPFWHHNSDNDKSPSALLEEFKKHNELKKITLERTQNIKVFDQAVRGNSLGGGKFDFTYKQSGIQYYELNFKNDTTSFKYDARFVYDKNKLQTFLMPDKRTTILYYYEGYRNNAFKLSL